VQIKIRDKLSLSNNITILRVLTILLLVYFAYNKQLLIFSILFYFCSASDYIDGPISRKNNSSSEFGSNLDYSADKILFLLSFLFIYLFRPEIILENIIVYILLIAIIISHNLVSHFKNKNKIKLHTNSGKIFIGFYYCSLPIILYLDSYRPLFYLCIILGSWSIGEMTILEYTRKDLSPEIKSLFNRKHDPFYYLINAFPMKAMLIPFIIYFIYLGEYSLFILTYYISLILDYTDGPYIKRILQSDPICVTINNFLNKYFIIGFLSALLVIKPPAYEMGAVYVYGFSSIILISLILNIQERYFFTREKNHLNSGFLVATYLLLPLSIILPTPRMFLGIVILIGILNIAYVFTLYAFYGKDSSKYASPVLEQSN
jgi:phosphatidylglycerophosphate synthase